MRQTTAAFSKYSFTNPAVFFKSIYLTVKYQNAAFPHLPSCHIALQSIDRRRLLSNQVPSFTNHNVNADFDPKHNHMLAHQISAFMWRQEMKPPLNFDGTHPYCRTHLVLPFFPWAQMAGGAQQLPRCT